MNAYRPLVRVLCAIFAIAIPGVLVSMDPVPLDGEAIRGIELQIHKNINRERISRSLPELNWNAELASEARRHAHSIAASRFLAHKDPYRGNVDRRLDSSGIRWCRCAENIYAGDSGGLAEEAVNAWRLSPDHFRNMTDSMFSEQGIGIAVRRDGTVIVVAEFILK